GAPPSSREASPPPSSVSVAERRAPQPISAIRRIGTVPPQPRQPPSRPLLFLSTGVPSTRSDRENPGEQREHTRGAAGACAWRGNRRTVARDGAGTVLEEMLRKWPIWLRRSSGDFLSKADSGLHGNRNGGAASGAGTAAPPESGPRGRSRWVLAPLPEKQAGTRLSGSGA